MPNMSLVAPTAGRKAEPLLPYRCRFRSRIRAGWLAQVLCLAIAGTAFAAGSSLPTHSPQLLTKSSGKPTRTLNVFAAASLMDPFNELGKLLETRQPGLQVRFNFAGSQQLAIQLEQGAVADVFASADARWMTYAADRGLLRGESQVFARNHLVVIVPSTNPARIQRLQDLARSGVKLVLGADAVPVGRYSRMALQALSKDPAFGGDYATRVLKNVVSEEENVKSVVGKVQLGEADAGMVYRSDVTHSVARFLKVLTLPASADIVAAYPIAAVSAGPDSIAAQAFLDLVLSPEGQKVLQRRGLMPASEAKP
jgi:molybdate transport system substrate-binding protein